MTYITIRRNVRNVVCIVSVTYVTNVSYAAYSKTGQAIVIVGVDFRTRNRFRDEGELLGVNRIPPYLKNREIPLNPRRYNCRGIQRFNDFNRARRRRNRQMSGLLVRDRRIPCFPGRGATTHGSLRPGSAFDIQIASRQSLSAHARSASTAASAFVCRNAARCQQSLFRSPVPPLTPKIDRDRTNLSLALGQASKINVLSYWLARRRAIGDPGSNITPPGTGLHRSCCLFKDIS